jgi:hypothetical protein
MLSEMAPMRIFIFKSEASRGLGAFAGDPGGRLLPTRFGPWHAVAVIAPDRDPPHNLRRDLIEEAINSKGFQLFRKKSKSPPPTS